MEDLDIYIGDNLIYMEDDFHFLEYSKKDIEQLVDRYKKGKYEFKKNAIERNNLPLKSGTILKIIEYIEVAELIIFECEYGYGMTTTFLFSIMIKQETVKLDMKNRRINNINKLLDIDI